MAKASSKDYFKKAQEAEKSGRPMRATRLYTRLAGHYAKRDRYTEAAMLLKKAVKLSNEKPRYLLLLAIADSRSGKDREARQGIRKLSRKILTLKRRYQIEQWVEKHLEPHPALLETFCECLLEVERTSARTFLTLARLRLKTGNPGGAIRCLLDGLKTRVSDSEIIAMLREVIQKHGPKDASEHVERFEQGKLERADLIMLLGDGGAGPADEGSNPDQKVEKTLSALIADLEKELGGKFDDGYAMVQPLIEEFRSKANEVLGDDGRARYDMAIAFFEMGLYREAQSELEQIPQTHRLYHAGQLLLGEILLKEESFLAALEVYQGFLRLDGQTPLERCEAEYRLIEIYYRLGDTGQALVHLRWLEREDPSYRDLRTFRMKLGRTKLETIGTGKSPRATSKK